MPLLYTVLAALLGVGYVFKTDWFEIAIEIQRRCGKEEVGDEGIGKYDPKESVAMHEYGPEEDTQLVGIGITNEPLPKSAGEPETLPLQSAEVNLEPENRAC